MALKKLSTFIVQCVVSRELKLHCYSY